MRARWPWSTLALAAALVVVQGDLWLGRGNMPQVASLQAQLTEQLEINRAATERNQRTAAELADLKEGLEMVEEKARRELGMVKPDEVLVQYTSRAGATSGTATPAPGHATGSATPPAAGSVNKP